VVGYFTYQLAAANRAEAERAQAAASSLASANRNLQAAEDAVRRGERLAALGQLTAGLAHELRNPMGTIRASAEMLGKNIGADNPLAAELAGYIASEVDRANALVTRFLEFARPLKLRLAPADLNDLIDHALDLVERGQPAPHCAIHRNFAPDVPAVQVDAELLERVVVNLVRNAIEASPAGADVTVRTRLLDGHAEIAVLDRGSGIAPAVREQIFNPFFTTKPEGVGLGLAIVHKIVDEHGGRIAVESETSKGSVFQVLLPLAPAAPR
jgi:two-component system sensor histidine kinase HydH